jgi:hypothetical protein
MDIIVLKLYYALNPIFKLTSNSHPDPRTPKMHIMIDKLHMLWCRMMWIPKPILRIAGFHTLPPTSILEGGTEEQDRRWTCLEQEGFMSVLRKCHSRELEWLKQSRGWENWGWWVQSGECSQPDFVWEVVKQASKLEKRGKLWKLQQSCRGSWIYSKGWRGGQ